MPENEKCFMKKGLVFFSYNSSFNYGRGSGNIEHNTTSQDDEVSWLTHLITREIYCKMISTSI